MTFCFDIDGVIMNIVPDNDYSLSTPIIENVALINYLFSKDHRIILYTARGSLTKINWENLTKQQLKDCKLMYHEIIFNKPAADYYIDDRLISIDEIKNKFKY
jgi:CMP-N,N'-diacetyllegionaminic acid synthase